MANACYYEMKIAGEKQNVFECIQMLRHEGSFKNVGLGRVYSFDFIDSTPEISDSNSNIIALSGSGDCGGSILCAMRKEYRNELPSLESESKRLGLVIEAYSSEPGNRFQEHVLINKGEVVVEESVDYAEFWLEAASEDYIQEVSEKTGIPVDELMNNLNANGDFCLGGFGDSFGDFSDLFQYFSLDIEKKPSLDSMIEQSSAKQAQNTTTLTTGEHSR